jgi:hypothetical protein
MIRIKPGFFFFFCDYNRRRSKSLDDLKIKEEYHRNNTSNLDCYKNESSPVSPIVMFDIDKPQKSELPKRRHSLSAEPSSTEYLRLAKIYGWTTTKDTTDNTVNSFHRYRKLWIYKSAL